MFGVTYEGFEDQKLDLFTEIEKRREKKGDEFIVREKRKQGEGGERKL